MQKLWRSMKLHRAHIAELCLSLQENETMGKVSPSFHSLSSFKQRPQHCCLHRCFGSSASSVCSVWFYACSVFNRQTSSPAHCIKHRCNDTLREQPLHHSKFQPPNLANSNLSLSSFSTIKTRTAWTCKLSQCWWMLHSINMLCCHLLFWRCWNPIWLLQQNHAASLHRATRWRLVFPDWHEVQATSHSVHTKKSSQNSHSGPRPPCPASCWAQLFINYHLQPQRQLKAEHTGQLTGHPVVPEIRNIRKASESQFRRKK